MRLRSKTTKGRRKKVFYLNCVESGYDLLERLLNRSIKIDHILSMTRKQARKRKVSGYCDFTSLARNHGIPIYYPKAYALDSNEDIEFFKREKPDLLLTFGWQRLVPKKILGTLKIGAIGAHGSSMKLPKGRGHSPINWSLIEGKKKFILHIFYMDEFADSGDIIDKTEFDLNEFDTCKTAYHKVCICLERMVVKNLPLILNGTAKRQAQKGKPTYYPKRTPEDGLIDWEKKTEDIYSLVRATTKPYPCAFTHTRNNEKMLIIQAQPFDSRIKYDAEPGEIVEWFSDGSIVIKTGNGTLLVTKFEIK